MSNWISVTDKLPEPDQWVIYHAPGIFQRKLWENLKVIKDNQKEKLIVPIVAR